MGYGRNSSGRRLGSVVAAGVVAALSVFVPSGATFGAQSDPDALLGVVSFATGTSIYVQSRNGLASVQLTVPQGYGVSVADAVGTEIGYVVAYLGDASGSLDGFVDGELHIDDPAKYAHDSDAQRCAPGTHAAVWRADFAVFGKTVALPIFVDPAPAGSTGPAALLSLCPAWPDIGIPGGLVSSTVSILTERAVTPPASAGHYTWSALVQPAHPGTATANPGGTFELRGVVPHPSSITLHARHDPKSKTVVLSGKVISAGAPAAGVAVSFTSVPDAGGTITPFGPARTNAAGEFSIRRRITVTTAYQAEVDATLRPCSSPSTAPAGCLLETVTPPAGAGLRVRVPGPRDAKLVPKPRAQALARRINLRPTDFPAGWQATGQSFSLFPCRGFSPDLSRLTVNGDVEGGAFVSETAAVSSSVSVYASAAEARIALARVGTLGAARCVAREIKDDDTAVPRVGPVGFGGLGGQVHAFRIEVSDADGSGYVDLVWMRHGRVVTSFVAAVIGELPLESDLLAKVAARARAG